MWSTLCLTWSPHVPHTLEKASGWQTLWHERARLLRVWQQRRSLVATPWENGKVDGRATVGFVVNASVSQGTTIIDSILCVCVRLDMTVDGRMRAGPGLGDKKHKKVYIPVDKYPDINFMGLLIGPRGSTQKRMEDESGARILIRGKGSSKDPTGEPDDNEELHVFITADTDEAVAKAQRAVEDILFNPQQAMKLKQEQLRKVAELNGTMTDTPRLGESQGDTSSCHAGNALGGEATSMDMKVPRDLVGYIIGRGGETIRDLQMKSGAHIQIVREEDGAPQTPDRFVNITGNHDALELAQRLIQNLIDERQQNQGAGGFRERDDRDRMARYGGINPDGTDSVEILVPNERVGLIIGRGGCTIKAIQQRTGTSVTIPQTPDPTHPDMRLITIRGTMEAKEAAKFEIQSMVSEEPGQRGAGFGMVSGQTIYMQVPDDRVGVIIGKRGETIKGIQDRHAVRIQIPQSADPGSTPPVRTISIQGPPQNLAGAKDEVDMVILQGVAGHTYGSGSHYGSDASYGAQAAGYDPHYGTYGQQPDPYASYYQQQGHYYQQEATAATTGTAANTGDQTTATTGTADPNDPNAYWNGYYEYAAYYGVDAANAAWGVTGAAAQASAEAYQQYQQQAGVASGADATAAPGVEATGSVPGVDAPASAPGVASASSAVASSTAAAPSAPDASRVSSSGGAAPQVCVAYRSRARVCPSRGRLGHWMGRLLDKRISCMICVVCDGRDSDDMLLLPSGLLLMILLCLYLCVCCACVVMMMWPKQTNRYALVDKRRKDLQVQPNGMDTKAWGRRKRRGGSSM
ncbi:hypothetical protein PsorP6_015594 [Peronosclerospora sorghi]|uniref:Uncharacterized protein n=1 Tax=Peronosclerospora sorghi TaxID=230839 RepID=A0ACC0WPT0_9STRA|nr:hypothetical protein PsorP6_015594 [Peronosclerospora sorghi]